MSSGPPFDTSPMQDEGPAAESPDLSGNGRGGRWRSITAVVGVLAVAGAVAAFLFFSSDPDAPTEQSKPAVGLACPDLQAAAETYERGDSASFEQSIAQAAKVAQETLQKSGQGFGEPERIALELELTPNQTPAHIERLLELAIQGCHDLGIS